MPQLVVAAAVEATFLVASVLATGGVPAFLLKAAGALVLGVVTSKLFGPKIADSVQALQSISVMVRSAIEYRKTVYGTARVSGPVVYNNLSGSDNEYLWFVVALCEGEIDDILEVHIDDRIVPKADIAWTAGENGLDGNGTGDVSTAEFVGENNTNAVQIYWALGHRNQVAMSKLTSTFADWGSNHRGRGVAYVVVRCLLNEDTEEIWETGAPQTISAVVKGARVYDPREPGHDYSDADTWMHTDEPALFVGDYLNNTMGVDPANRIDWDSIEFTSDFNEKLVDINTASPPATEVRFTGNGVISEGQTHKDNLDAMLSAFDGRLSRTPATWRVRESGFRAPDFTITESDLAGEVQVIGSAEYQNRKNTIRGIFVDPARNYEATEFPLTTVAAYVTRDAGKVLTADLELPLTNTYTMAQRIAYRMLEQFNNQIVARLIVKAKGAQIAIGDVGTVTIDKFGWSAKTFRVIEWQRNPNFTYALTLREDYESSYDDPLGSEYGTTPIGGPNYPGQVIPPAMSLSASPVPYGNKLTWTNPAAGTFEYADVYASENDQWSGRQLIASVRTNTYTHNLPSGTTRYYWVQMRGVQGRVSTRLPDSDTSNVSSTAGTDGETVQLAGAMLSDKLVTTNDAEVAYRIASTGEEQSAVGDGAAFTDIADWLLAGAAGDYDVRLTVNSGTAPSGSATGTWLACSTTRTWTLTDTTEGGGVISNICTVEIRDGTSLDVLASASVTMEVERQTPTVTLSGTSGSPNVANDIQFSPTDANARWAFNSDGTVDRNGQQFAAATEWIIPNNPTATYYLRAQLSSGSAPTTGTLNTWLALTTDRTYTWTVTGLGTLAGTLRIDIATDAAGTNIVASGYYRGNAVVNLDVG